MSEFDLGIIGGGPAGYVAAIRAAQLGLQTALIEERDTLGGTCLNVGCIPSKALLDSSELFARIRDEAAEHGIVAGAPVLDLATMMQRKAGVVDKLTSGVASLVKGNGVTLFQGIGWIRGPGEVAVHPAGKDPRRSRALETISCKRILVATGSVPTELPFLPFDGDRVLSSTDALSLGSVPGRLVVVGAGVIGLELGSVYRRLGAQVEVIEILPQVLAGWDRGLSKVMQRELKRQGFAFHLNTQVTGAKPTKKGVRVDFADKSGEPGAIEADRVLVAVGRSPRLDTANLKGIGCAVEAGRLSVDENYATSVDGVYAVGDIVAGPMLAHKAEEEGAVAVERMAGVAGHVNYGAIPNVVYTWPEAASVGLTEEQLKEAGRPYRSGTFPFAANGRALAMASSAGQVKILADESTDRVLGAHIVGPWASDLIMEIATVIEFGGSAEDIARTTHPHPTLSEAVKEAALGVDGRMIHTRR